jgi:hypothetical protein
LPRVRSQLAIQAPPELLERLRAAAEARGQTVTRLLIGWIEAGLAGGVPAPGPAGGGAELVERLAVLEALTADLAQAVAELRARGPAPRSPRRVSPSPPHTGEGPSPDQVSPAAGPTPDGAITTAELADRTGSNRAAWNTWASKAAPGAVRHHPQAGPWRLLGKGPGPNGGPDRWLWEPA